MIYTQKRQPQLCDEFSFKIYSGYTHSKQPPVRLELGEAQITW